MYDSFYKERAADRWVIVLQCQLVDYNRYIVDRFMTFHILHHNLQLRLMNELKYMKYIHQNKS